ncbi:MAG TPA: hypothetical protein VGP07_21770 [Polyangia bacterium]|jgi:hypothetical protein
MRGTCDVAGMPGEQAVGSDPVSPPDPLAEAPPELLLPELPPEALLPEFPPE